MAKWEVPTAEEETELRALGKDPGAMVVNRVGEGARLFLDLKTREEIYVRGRIAAAETAF